jgi:hypothetical protein
LQKVSAMFVSKRCLGKVKDFRAAVTHKSMDIGNEVELDKTGKFCYLGDMLNSNGGTDLAVVARVRCAWKKFKELVPFFKVSLCE